MGETVSALLAGLGVVIALFRYLRRRLFSVGVARACQTLAKLHDPASATTLFEYGNLMDEASDEVGALRPRLVRFGYDPPATDRQFDPQGLEEWAEFLASVERSLRRPWWLANREI